jgi:hypothetical protein
MTETLVDISMVIEKENFVTEVERAYACRVKNTCMHTN